MLRAILPGCGRFLSRMNNHLAAGAASRIIVTPTATCCGVVSRRGQRRKIFLDNGPPACSCFVHVPRPNPRLRSASGRPSNAHRPLSLVRKLIDYGKQLAGTVRHRAAVPGFALFAKPFGTADLAAILDRITAGLRRAAALEATLCQRAARGRDLEPASIRMPAARGPRAAPQVVPPDVQAADHTEDPRLARLPTEAEIAVEVRRRPVGAVIADICRDLGIAPGRLDRAFWDELSHAIIAYGGSLAGFLGKLNRRMFAFVPGDHADPAWTAPGLSLERSRVRAPP